MVKLSQLLNYIVIGNPAHGVGGTTTIESVTINTNTGAVSAAAAGSRDCRVNNGQFTALKVWNSVWNDFADFQLLDDNLEYGVCYFDTKNGAKICTERCQKSVIGIASDTFGYAAGQGANSKEVPIAVAGWALAYVDKEYDAGTVLTNNEKGQLTEMTEQEKLKYPERIVAIYKKKETALEFGVQNKIKVNGRHWVKVKS